MNRREFTKKLTFAGSSISLQLSLMQSVAAGASDADDYKAVVCLLLAGGIDSYRMLLPIETSQHEKYHRLRGIAASGLGPLDTGNYTRIGTSAYALNNQFGGVWAGAPLKNNVAFVANVGSLIEPINTVREYIGGKRVPFALTSHNDQIKQLQTLDYSGQSAIGWMGRLVKHYRDTDLTEQDLPSANITLSGTNYAQSSESSSPFAIGNTGPAQLQPISSNATSPRVVAHKNALFNDPDSIMGCPDYKRNVLQQLYADISRKAFIESKSFSEDFSSVTINAGVPGSMQTLVKAMRAGRKQGLKRQTFFLSSAIGISMRIC